MLNEVKEYWKKFRGECDELIERDIGGVIAEQIRMTDRILEMFDTIEALQQEVEQLQAQNGAMVERLEWVDNDYCPICWQYKANGHANDCELAALLKESEGLE